MATTETQTPLIRQPSLAPSYTTYDELSPANGRDIELTSFSGRSSTSVNEVEDGPPPYARGELGAFHADSVFQIQTPGKNLLSFPTPTRPDPIPVFRVDAVGQVLDDAAYTSLRPERRSGNCYLVPGDSDGAATARPLSTTTYRFGPGKPPVIVLVDPNAALPPPLSEAREEVAGSSSAGSDTFGAAGEWDRFEFKGRSLFSRAVRFRNRLGTFEWRYAARKERAAAVPGGANSVLVLDRITAAFPAGGGKAEEQRTAVARFVRNEEFRTPGTTSSTSGNGGRLFVDLATWPADEDKTERRMAEAMVVTTVISMLKKEVDRRRAQQIAVMSAAASGGGP